MQLDTFVFQVDEKLQISAIEMINCVNAVLENAISLNDMMNKGGLLGDAVAETEKTVNQKKYEQIVHREDNFWSVYHDLLSK